MSRQEEKESDMRELDTHITHEQKTANEETLVLAEALARMYENRERRRRRGSLHQV